MRPLTIAFVSAIVLVGAARADELSTTTTAAPALPGPATSTTAPAATEPPPQDTKVLGTPPDLVGRWLAVGWIAKADKEKTITVAAPWEISRRDGRLELKELYVELPQALRDALEKANANEQPWKPSPAEIDGLDAAWDHLEFRDPRYAACHHEIAGPDGFPEEVKKEERSKDAILVIRQRLDAAPSAVPLIRQVQVWAATARADGGYTGNYDVASLAAVPFPVPIQFKGTFRIYPVAKAPSEAGLLARLLDVFRGCGRAR